MGTGMMLFNPEVRSFDINDIDPEHRDAICALIKAEQKSLKLRSVTPIDGDPCGIRVVLEADTHTEGVRDYLGTLVQGWLVDKGLDTDRTRHQDRLVIKWREPVFATT